MILKKLYNNHIKHNVTVTGDTQKRACIATYEANGYSLISCIQNGENEQTAQFVMTFLRDDESQK